MKYAIISLFCLGLAGCVTTAGSVNTDTVTRKSISVEKPVGLSQRVTSNTVPALNSTSLRPLSAA